MENMEKKIRKVMAAVFGIDESAIEEDSSPDSLEEWDSIKHLNLVMALEEEFKIKFSDSEMIEIMNYKLINLILKNKLIS